MGTGGFCFVGEVSRAWSWPLVPRLRMMAQTSTSPYIWMAWCLIKCKNNLSFLGFEVLTAVIMKIAIFWSITPCSPLSVNRRFGGTYRLHLQRLKISWARNQCESKLQAEWWRWRRYVPSKRRLTLNGLHGIISQKMVLFNFSFTFIYLCVTCPYANDKCAGDVSAYWIRDLPAVRSVWGL
jgi:hypothetical protein